MSHAVPDSPQARGEAFHLDRHGLIVQADGDGGDTAQRMGWFWFGVWLREQIGDPWPGPPVGPWPADLDTTIDLLEYENTGRWMRHPDQKDCAPGTGDGGCNWKSDPFGPQGFSRDQQAPLIAALGVWGKNDALIRMQNAVTHCAFVPRWMRGVEPFRCVQGTNDIVDADHANLFSRALGNQPSVDGDMLLAGSVASRLLQTNPDLTENGPNDTSNDLSLVVRLALAAFRSPSQVSEAARDSYAKNRGVSHGAYLTQYREAYPSDYGASDAEMVRRIDEGRQQKAWQPECPRVQSALRWYLRAETNGNPLLADLYEPVVRGLLS